MPQATKDTLVIVIKDITNNAKSYGIIKTTLKMPNISNAIKMLIGYPIEKIHIEKYRFGYEFVRTQFISITTTLNKSY